MQTLQKQISLFGETGLTYLPEGFHANHTALAAKEKAQKITATSGRICLEQFEKFNRSST